MARKSGRYRARHSPVVEFNKRDLRLPLLEADRSFKRALAGSALSSLAGGRGEARKEEPPRAVWRADAARELSSLRLCTLAINDYRA